MEFSNTSDISEVNTNFSNENPNQEDIFKILVATDVHLGYCEKDPIRGDDSFNTFEEILKHAVVNEVDFLLLGGDLFHENKPSVTCYHRCISLLKRYCLGDKPVAFEFLSDQSRNFLHLKNPVVNYEDPNLNISLPVFSIHGNHDDPTGANQLSAMDIVADTGLMNYFGKWNDLTQVEIYPLLMKKGQTKLALYGLSHIKDERLSRLFRDNKVTMLRPQGDDWFHVLVLHQNRAQNRGVKNYIPESVIPTFVNLVIWGHEHDCLITPEFGLNGQTRISQPGSSVATSLTAGESYMKKIGLLCVYKTKFIMEEIRLETVRPFVFSDTVISKPEGGINVQPSVYGRQKVMEIVETMLKKAKDLETNESPKLPLLRLVVHFTEDSLVNNQIRLGQQYLDRVANPTSMFSFKVKKNISVKRENKNDLKDLEEMIGDDLADNINGLVNKYFEMKHETLQVLSTRGLCEAVSRYIDRNDTDALEDIYNHQLNKTFDKLLAIENLNVEDDASIDELLTELRQDRANKENEEQQELSNLFNAENRPKISQNLDRNLEISEDDMDIDINISASTSAANNTSTKKDTARPARGRGSRGPRKTRANSKK